MTASQRRAWLLRTLDRGSHLIVLLATVGACFLIVAISYERRTHPIGDEPHYLVISETLLKYHSLDVAKTYDSGGYHSFYSGVLDLSHTVTNYRGLRISVHGVGAPILWLPLFAVAGRMGAILFMMGIALLVIVDIFRFLDEHGVSRRTAVLVAAFFATATPIFAFAHLTFVDLIGAWAVIYLFRKILKNGELHRRELVASSLLVGILPWVHVKFIVLESLLLTFLLLKLVLDNRIVPIGVVARMVAARRREICWTVLPAAVLGLGFELFNHAIWNSFDPALVYGQIDRGMPFTESPVPGLIGTFLDQEYGVFISAPILMLAIPGFVLSLRDRVGAVSLYFPLLAVCYIALFAARHDWYGGWTPPGRFILVVLPMFAYYIGYLLDGPNRLLAWLAFLVFGLMGTAYNLVSLYTTNWGFSTGVGQNQTIAYIQRALLHRSSTLYLPSTVRAIDYRTVMAWMLVVCVVSGLALLKVPAGGRRMSSRTGGSAP